jgi:Mn-dependent DtxR family transcriptional regulator
MILKKGVVLTPELKVLRLILTVQDRRLSMKEIEVVPGLTMTILNKMKDEGLVIVVDDNIIITEKGIRENEKTIDHGDHGIE